MRFKLLKNLPEGINKNLDLMNYCVYQLFMFDSKTGLYKGMKIDMDWANQQSWFKMDKRTKTMDFNDINKIVGYPPYYIVVKRKDKIEDTIKKEFPTAVNIIVIGGEVDFEVKEYALPDYKKGK